MKSVSKRHRDLAKLERVIDSCLNYDQADVAERMVKQYEKYYDCYTGLFNELWGKQVKLITEKQRPPAHED